MHFCVCVCVRARVHVRERERERERERAPHVWIRYFKILFYDNASGNLQLQKMDVKEGDESRKGSGPGTNRAGARVSV